MCGACEVGRYGFPECPGNLRFFSYIFIKENKLSYLLIFELFQIVLVDLMELQQQVAVKEEIAIVNLTFKEPNVMLVKITPMELMM